MYLKLALRALVASAGLFLLCGTPAAYAAEGQDLAVRGDAKCTRCHDENASAKTLTIGQRRHGTKADARTPGCTSCHGASDRHMADPNKVRPDVLFKGAGAVSAAAASQACLNCHNGGKRNHWATSRHSAVDVTCTNCHVVHAPTDAVQDKRLQAEVCFACHKQQRTEVNKPSHHPIPEGKMSCSDCHNPHGSAGPKNMKRDSVNETCYTCHMEKRGPFVHNHEPVSEDCTNCHNPHGTTAESMLKARPPFLCHQCHTPHGAQVAQIAGQGQDRNIGGATLQTPTSSGKSGINYFMARGCVNCHTQVHGSNNPSATNPTPQFFLR
ncbi:MAG: DmsE family decaheme c-type cytochrome [Betaproteobacteria bacterium]